MKFSFKIVLIAIPLIALALAAWLIARQGYTSEQAATQSFTIDESFDVVRKVLVRKDGAKQIITMGGASEFVAQEWDDLDVEFASLRVLKDWRLNLTGVLQVRTLDEYVGEHVISLDQQVEITPDLVDSQVTLNTGTKKLLDYEMTTRFSRNDVGLTQVELELRQKIHTHAPFFAASIADRQVRESAERTVANQERAIRLFIDDNKAEFLEEAASNQEEKSPGPLRRLIDRLRD